LARLRAELAALQEDYLPAFRRELATLLASKFEFIEGTLHERQEGLRKGLADREDQEHVTTKKSFLLVAGLVGLSIAAQILFHLMQTPGAGK
jgi:hypothetical protein